MSLVRSAPQNAGVGETLQPRREHVGGDSKARLKLIKAVLTLEDISNDEQAPAFAHEVERAGDRAVHPAKVSLQRHGKNFNTEACITQVTMLGYRHA